MTFSAGEQLGTYEIIGSLGAGGMGEVYRARDTRLKREVAIKILPEVFSRDAERLARFQREAEVLASLNHRHIAAIYDLVDFGPSPFLVLELVEGETLADRIQRGRIPIPEALRIATQMAEALEAAHEKGIIHRDVKPANIKITPDGNVKVLDFGLAKMRDVEGGSADLSNCPTIMATSPGMMMGTAPYMSPEQANGRPADRSSDMWAFGCVLYEMLTGRRPFEGETVTEIVAGIVKADPDWRRLPAETPEGIRRLLRRCLRKERTLRFRNAGDARLEIDDAQTSQEQDGRATPIRPARRERLTWASALALVTLIAALMGVRAFRPAAIAPETRLEITTPPTGDSAMAISPDGLKIVFAARSAGQPQLWLRSLDSPSARPLPGTERASIPFWSPDSRSIGFFADRKLKRMDIDGGSAQTLASAPSGLGGAWNRDGTILFSSNPGRPIFRIPAGGGEPAAVTRFEWPQQGSQAFPRFLTDDRHFLFFVTGRLEARGVYIGNLDGLETKRLFDADTPAVYAAGYLFFVREGNLLAQDFDSVRLEPKGDPLAVAEHINGGTVLSASAAGLVVYRTPSPDSGQRYLVWIDRSGRDIDRVVYPDTASPGPSLSHDGRRVAVFRYVNGNMDIWSYETERRTWDRVTFDSGDDIFPLWSPDGRSIVFGSNRKTGFMNLYRKLLSAAPGSEELLLSTSQPKFPMDWSPDGRFLLYNGINARGDLDIWSLPLDGTRTPFEVVQTEFNEQLPQFSPDGKWIAYQSDKTGRFEIYVQPFPGPGGASPVSTNGGSQVRWNPNGKEVFYIAADDRLMALPIRLTSDGKTVEAGTPLGLFATNVSRTANVDRHHYMVAPDGQSFVMSSRPEGAAASPITVILNWKPKP